MLMQLDQLIPPQRIAGIKSLEILYEFFEEVAPWSYTVDPEGKADVDKFSSTLKKISELLPNLKSLYFSVQWIGRIHVLDTGVLRPMELLLMQATDSFIAGLGTSLWEIYLAVPASMYKIGRDSAVANGDVVEHAAHGQLERYWRPLSGPSAHKGYWVRLGQKDLKWPDHSTVMGAVDPRYMDTDWILYAR